MVVDVLFTYLDCTTFPNTQVAERVNLGIARLSSSGSPVADWSFLCSTRHRHTTQPRAQPSLGRLLHIHRAVLYVVSTSRSSICFILNNVHRLYLPSYRNNPPSPSPRFPVPQPRCAHIVHNGLVLFHKHPSICHHAGPIKVCIGEPRSSS